MENQDPKLFEAKQHRAKLIHDQRQVLERAGIVNGEYRALSPEDKESVDKMAGDVDNLDELIDRLQALQSADVPDEDRDEDDQDDKDKEERSYRSKRFGKAQRRSMPVPLERSDKPKHNRDSKEYRQLHAEWLKTGYFDGDIKQYRDVVTNPNSSGGYLATPTKISDNIVQIINNLCFMMGLAKVTTLTDAISLGVRQITTQPSDALWTAEIGSTVVDTAMAFGQRPLTPNLLAKAVNVSLRELSIVPDVEDVVTDRLGYKLAVAMENAFLKGSGSSQPLGVFTPSANGIPTSQDVVCSTSGAPTQITADSLISAKYGLKQPYLQGDSCSWIFSRAVTAQIRLLKDSYGRYLWVDGGGFASAPDTILGIPNRISEYAPSALTAGAYVGILGNFAYYEIAMANIMEIQRLNELYAGTNEVGFIGRKYIDGAPVLGEAFARLILHS